MKDLIKNVKIWADNKDLLKKENVHAQMLKVLEEVGETAGAGEGSAGASKTSVGPACSCTSAAPNTIIS